MVFYISSYEGQEIQLNRLPSFVFLKVRETSEANYKTYESHSFKTILIFGMEQNKKRKNNNKKVCHYTGYIHTHTQTQ